MVKRTARRLTIILLCSLVFAGEGAACSCAWGGPFLKVAPEAPLIVRGRVTRHDRTPAPAMAVFVLETLKGALLDSGLVVQMGDGMHCRPPVEMFPPGTEWILALNGPGSKPGRGLALSHCGEYWLRVEGGEAVGAVEEGPPAVKRIPLEDLRRRIKYPKFREEFSGRAKRGKRYGRSFGPGFTFSLEPTPTGWEIAVSEIGRDENLARLTPPLHFVPNPREIEGWQFLADPSRCPERPYGAEAGPGLVREFVFSPEVGKTIGGEVTPEDVEAIRRFGRGTLTIRGFTLQGEAPCPAVEEMEFTVLIEGGGI